MTKIRLVVNLAGIETAFRLHYSGTEMLFCPYAEKKLEADSAEELTASVEEIEAYASENGCSLEFAEYTCLRRAAGKKLAEKGRAMFHGVAFICGEGAYILTAPSGTGKSTQLMNLSRLYGEKYRVISGDKPILRLEKDRTITVFPSPWNGKEFWGGRKEGTLKGVILLEQGKENIIQRMTPENALIPILQQFLYMTAEETGIRTMCRITDAMLTNIPVFSYINRGDDLSSVQLNTLIDGLEQKKRE